MIRTTPILVEADIQILFKGEEKAQEITIKGIPCEWNWDETSRSAAEAWAVHDWIDNTFGDNIQTYWIFCVVGSPVKEIR